MNFGPLPAPNEPNSPAGVFIAVVFGVSYGSELSLVDTPDAAEDTLLPPLMESFAVFEFLEGIEEIVTLSKTRREFDRVRVVGLTADTSDDLVSDRSSTSEEFSTKLRVETFLSNRLLGLRELGGVALAASHIKVSKHSFR